MLAKQQICFLGAGNMAEAIMVGLLEQQIPAKQIIASDPLAARLKQLEVNLQIRTCSSNKLAVAGADLVVLSVKPQVAMGVLQELGGSLPPDCLVLSIMAGVTTTTIEEALPAGTRVIRAMPNTPALVQQAATALCTGRAATPQDVNVAMELFNALGSVYQVSEGQMDIVTGLSGSGPAYVFSFIEALSDAGVKNGLPRDIAHGLAVQTVLGAAQLVKQSGEHPALLRERVSSPGGTTIAALHQLESGCFNGTIMDAVDAAVRRSKELAGR